MTKEDRDRAAAAGGTLLMALTEAGIATKENCAALATLLSAAAGGSQFVQVPAPGGGVFVKVPEGWGPIGEIRAGGGGHGHDEAKTQ